MALVAAHPAQPPAVAAGQRSVWRSVRPGRINWNEDDVEFWQQAEGVWGTCHSFFDSGSSSQKMRYNPAA